MLVKNRQNPNDSSASTFPCVTSFFAERVARCRAIEISALALESRTGRSNQSASEDCCSTHSVSARSMELRTTTSIMAHVPCRAEVASMFQLYNSKALARSSLQECKYGVIRSTDSNRKTAYGSHGSSCDPYVDTIALSCKVTVEDPGTITSS